MEQKIDDQPYLSNQQTYRGDRALSVKKDLTHDDLARTKDLLLGQHVVPGSANARLVGGRWRYVPNVLPEEPMFTE